MARSSTILISPYTRNLPLVGGFDDGEIREVCDRVKEHFFIPTQEFYAGSTPRAVTGRCFAAALLLFQHFFDRSRIAAFLDMTPEQMEEVHRVFRRFFVKLSINPDAHPSRVLGQMTVFHAAHKRPLDARIFAPTQDAVRRAASYTVALFAAHLGLSTSDLIRSTRNAGIVCARTAAAYACRYLHGARFRLIAGLLQRDETTISHAIVVVDKRLIASGGPPPRGLDLAQLMTFLLSRLPELAELRRASAFSHPEKRKIT